MTNQEKLNKVDKAIASPTTPKEFIPDLKKRKAELEKNISDKEDKEKKHVADKKARTRKSIKSGKKIKKKARSLAAIKKDAKYFNPEQKHEIAYAKKSGRIKKGYKKGEGFFKEGGVTEK